jgi:hypothetical protein
VTCSYDSATISDTATISKYLTKVEMLAEQFQQASKGQSNPSATEDLANARDVMVGLTAVQLKIMGIESKPESKYWSVGYSVAILDPKDDSANPAELDFSDSEEEPFAETASSMRSIGSQGFAASASQRTTEAPPSIKTPQIDRLSRWKPDTVPVADVPTPLTPQNQADPSLGNSTLFTGITGTVTLPEDPDA